MRIFVSNHVVLVLLVVTTAVDASRIFYLPLPKIHSSKQNIQEPPNFVEEAPKKQISDEFIPPSAMEQEEIEKRGDTFDWEQLIDKEAAIKRRITVNELLPESVKQLSERYPSDVLMESKATDEIQRDNSFSKISETFHENVLEEPWLGGSVNGRAERLQTNAALNSGDRRQRRNDTLFFVIVGTCCMIGVVGLVAATIFWYKIQKRARDAADVEYPSYGVTGPNSTGGKISPSSTMSDRKLAQSAQMFHYQQQRQQMMAQEKDLLDAKANHSDDSDDEAPGGGDYTVYECPGLAPTGEMEVRNPLFTEPDSSIIIPPNNTHYSQLSTSPPKEKSLP
ncbi:hypothetical protein I4U23_024752 [Adineta vaga]|nr:hypothetical protein I4U23_024752 [Adineta vaga]